MLLLILHIASGLIYLAELVEEYAFLTKKVIRYAIFVCDTSHSYISSFFPLLSSFLHFSFFSLLCFQYNHAGDPKYQCDSSKVSYPPLSSVSVYHLPVISSLPSLLSFFFHLLSTYLKHIGSDTNSHPDVAVRGHRFPFFSLSLPSSPSPSPLVPINRQ